MPEQDNAGDIVRKRGKGGMSLCAGPHLHQINLRVPVQVVALPMSVRTVHVASCTNETPREKIGIEPAQPFRGQKRKREKEQPRKELGRRDDNLKVLLLDTSYYTVLLVDSIFVILWKIGSTLFYSNQQNWKLPWRA